MWFLEKTELYLCQTMAPKKLVFRGALKSINSLVFRLPTVDCRLKKAKYNEII
ncbi:unnamed protein product [marine sediment metagenome]|uniref:Uncharacterized protein n=1 Tax=marine sediment metagenome TaxID=412755 RepID=X1GTX6_9ZZZZ